MPGGTLGRLARFVGTRIRSRTAKASAPPDPARCLVVEKIARAGIALVVGLEVGDRVATIDDAPATDRGPGPHVRGTRWEIYRMRAGEMLELVTAEGDLGVELWRSGEAMDACDAVAPRELEQLWKRGDWARLERLSRARLRDRRDDPALALLGAALVELGRAPEGEAMAAEYAREFTSHWPMCYTAVALYYGALAAMRDAGPALGGQLLEVAYAHEPYERIGAAIARVAGRPSPPAPVGPRWLGQKFPVRYALARIDAPASRVALGDELAALGDGQVLVVVLMAEQRTNGPYDAFMKRYRAYATDLRPFVRGVHVLTSVRERPKARPDLFEGEDAVKAAALPFTLLEDGGNAVSDALQPKGVPDVFLLDRRGVVLHQGMLEPVDLWDALGRLDEGADAAPPSRAGGTRPRWMPIAGAVGVVVLALSVLRACGGDDRSDDGVGAASRAVTVPSSIRAAFSRSDPLYVEVTLTTLEAANRARAAKGGVLTASDVDTKYTLRPVNVTTEGGTREVLYLAAHTTEDTMMRGSAYQPMSSTQLLQLARWTPRCGGLYLDGANIEMPAIELLVAELPPQPSAAFDVRQAGGTRR